MDADCKPCGVPMKSEERRAARRARRDAKRAANRAKRIESCTLEEVADIDNLYRCARDCAHGVAWKSAVQRYLANILPNVLKTHADLMAGKDIRRGFVEFDIFERGKLRHITSVHYSERVVHKALNRYALAPAIWPTLAPGCTANIKGRGTDFAVSRLKQQLARHYQKHGAEGYVLLVDFSNFFGNIDHAATKRLIDRALDDERIKALMYAQVDSHGTRGLGLGSEPNQILAVALPSPVDHMLLRTPCVLASGRYMDDLYCIALDKADLRGVLADIRRECAKLGIVVNEKKTRIVKLTRGFTFLKKRFNYGETGKVIVRPCRSAVTRERRKLKKLAAFVERGEMTRDQALQRCAVYPAFRIAAQTHQQQAKPAIVRAFLLLGGKTWHSQPKRRPHCAASSQFTRRKRRHCPMTWQRLPQRSTTSGRVAATITPPVSAWIMAARSMCACSRTRRKRTGHQQPRRAFGRVTLPQPTARTQRMCPHGSSRTLRTDTQPARW